MGRCYCGYGAAAVGGNKTILTLIGATTIRPALYDVIVGCGATPGDQAAVFVVQRFTAVGTEGNGFTPVALDPGDPASLADCGVGTFTVEPTYTSNAIVLPFSLNQRAPWRWVAAPGGRIYAPAIANNGLGLKSISASGTAVHEAGFHWEE